MNSTELLIDPACLDERQRDGDACAACHKAWPRPEIVVGRLPDDRAVYACPECASAFPSVRATAAQVTPLTPPVPVMPTMTALPGAAARAHRRHWKIRLAR